MKNKKNIVFIILVIIITLNFGYSFFIYYMYNLEKTKQDVKIKNLESRISILNKLILENNKSSKKNDTIEQFNIDNDPLKDFDDSIDQFKVNNDPFKSLDDFIDESEDVFNRGFDVNINQIQPGIRSNYSRSNLYIVNGKVFSYNIDVNGDQVKGTISTENKELITKIEQLIIDLNYNTEIDGNTLNFNGTTENIDKLLNILNNVSSINLNNQSRDTNTNEEKSGF